MSQLPFTQEQLTAIREGHIQLIWDAHHDMIEDAEAFDEYLNKMAAAHTIITMMAIEKDRENGTNTTTEGLDSGEGDQVSEA